MKLPIYVTPFAWTCPFCGELATIKALENELDYPGYGGGTHYPPDWGTAICSSCETPLEGYADVKS